MGQRVRRARMALLIGLALAGSLSLAVIPAVIRLHAQGRLVAGSIDPRLVDALVLALNAAFFVAFVTVHRLRRSRRGVSDPDAPSE